MYFKCIFLQNGCHLYGFQMVGLLNFRSSFANQPLLTIRKPDTYWFEIPTVCLVQPSAYSCKKMRNGMLRYSLGGEVIFISLQHFIAPALDLMPCLQARGTRDCNKGIKFKKGAFKCCKKEKFPPQYLTWLSKHTVWSKLSEYLWHSILLLSW